MTMVGEDQARHGLYKSAVLLVSLGSELAAQVLSQMDDRHVERLIGEMIRLRHVDAVERDRVVEEFTSRLEGEAGGPDPRDEGRGMRDERRSRLSSSLIPRPSSLSLTPRTLRSTLGSIRPRAYSAQHSR